MMKGIFNENTIRRVIATFMSLVMMISLISAYVPVSAASNEQTDGVTITVIDENGNAVSDAEVSYSITSVKTSEVRYTGTKNSDEKGVVEILPQNSFVANEFTVTAQISKTGYKKDVTSIVNRSINSESENFSVTLVSTSITGISVTPYVGEYDDNTHQLINILGSKIGDNISYSVNRGDFTKNIPSEKKVGKYSITVKIERAGYADYITTVDAEITLGTIKNIKITPYNKDYDGSSHNSVILSGLRSSDTVIYNYKGENLSTAPSIIDAGEYEVTIIIKRINYKDYVENVTAKINPTSIEGLTVQAKENLVYTGSAQELVIGVSGTQVGDKIEYSKDNTNWTENIPTGENAGEYTVYTRVTRNNNFKVTYLPGVKVNIGKKKVGIRFKNTPPDSITYQGNVGNSYDFSAVINDRTVVGKIEYNVDFAESGEELGSIDDAAIIDSEGKLTLKQSGFVLKVMAQLKSDNYDADPLETILVVTNPETQGLISFKSSEIEYILGRSDIVARQIANKKHRRDNSVVSYTASVVGHDGTLEDYGIVLSSTSGQITISSYKKLADLIASSSDKKVKLKVTALKDADRKHNKVVYAADSASYTVVIKFETSPEVKEDTTAESGTDKRLYTVTGTPKNTWYTDIEVKPLETNRYNTETKYYIARNLSDSGDTNGEFSESVKFGGDKNYENEDQGDKKRLIFLRNKETKGITAPIFVVDNSGSNYKIDSKAPASEDIKIKYPDDYNKNAEDAKYYKDKLNVEFSAMDNLYGSGVDTFEWKYKRRENVSESNKNELSGVVKAVKDTTDGIYKANITLPEGTEQLNGSLEVRAIDVAGNISNSIDDSGNVFVYDNIAPNVNTQVRYVSDCTQFIEDSGVKTAYTSKKVDLSIIVNEINFFAEDVKIDVKKDGRKYDAVADWKVNDDEKDTYTGQVSFTEEGEYCLQVSYQDRSLNEKKSSEEYRFIIKTTVPTIEWSYDDKTDDGNNSYQIATVTVTDKYFTSGNIVVAGAYDDGDAGKNINGETVYRNAEQIQSYLRNRDNWTQDEKNKEKYTAIISKLPDAIYSLTIGYSDLATNGAESVATGIFVSDHSAPDKIQISYSKPTVWENIKSAVSFGYYKSKVKVSFTANDYTSGVKEFEWAYNKQKNASNINLDKYEQTAIDAIQDAKDKSKFTASVVIPYETAVQLRGNISVMAADKMNNKTGIATDTKHVIVVDSISPDMSITYSDAEKVVNSRRYYNKDVILTFDVKEANFDKNDVAVQITKNGKTLSLKAQNMVWKKQKAADTYRGTLTIPAAKNHSADGEYVVSVRYSDKSGNVMQMSDKTLTKKYTSPVIVVDTTSPEVYVTYNTSKAEKTLKDTEGHNRQYYSKTRVARVKIVETNFNAENVKLSIDAKDVSGRTIDSNVTKSKWSNSGDVHTMTITYPGDANYTFSVSYTDEANNGMQRKYTPDYFTVDKTAPTNLSVSYSRSVLDTVLQNVSMGFYNSKVTVTITAEDSVSGINEFKYGYRTAAGVSPVNAELLDQLLAGANIVSRNGISTATFEVPGSVLTSGTQFNGNIEFTAIDRANNESGKLQDTKRIVADNISPTAEVTYNNPVQRIDGASYYDGDINATITVNEANFYSEDVNVSVTKDGGTYPINVSWTSGSTDVHTGTFTLTEDGDYNVQINYSDKSSNQMAVYTSEQLTIDTKMDDPIITINGQSANGKAFKDDVKPAVSFSDDNLASYTVKMTRTRYEKQNEDVTDMFVKNKMSVNYTTGNGEGVFGNLDKIQDNDGIYTLTVSIEDKAGHKKSKTATFTVNRFGSVYIYSDYLSKLVADGGAYTKSVDEDLVITEYNPDKLVSNSLDIEISCDGKPVDSSKINVTPSIDNNVKIGSSGWYQYRYTIDKSAFSSDGLYKVLISSEDKTGNSPQNTNYKDKEIMFRVDSSAPEINSITGLEKSIINATEVDVRYTVYDTIGLASVVVYVNGKEVGNITDFSSDANNFSGNFKLTEKNAVQTVELVVTDKAGNVIDTSSPDFKSAYAFNSKVTVSTSMFVRWFANKPLFYGSIAIVILLIMGLMFIIIASKKKKNEEQ